MIKERGEAKRTYETAKSEGRKTTLVEQERPNLFTTSVANIGPARGGRPSPSSTRRRCATTTAPSGCAFRSRSRRATSRARRSRRTKGTPAARAGRLPRSRCRTPTASRRPSRPRSEGYVNPVRIAIDLNAGFPLVAAREHLPPDDDRGARRPSLSTSTLAGRPDPRGTRLRAHVDAGHRRRPGRRAVHRDQGRQDLRAADGAAAAVRGRRRPCVGRAR